VGRKRAHNEDSYLLRDDLGLFAVADGMGGHLGGADASRMAVSVVEREVERQRIAEGQRGERPTDPATARRFLAEAEQTEPFGPPDGSDGAAGASYGTEQQLRTAIRVAGASIFRAAQRDSTLAGMGTTLTALLLREGKLTLAHVGDSRAYRIRGGHWTQLTDDHSWVSEQVRAGALSEAEAKESRYRHIITRSVGFEQDVNVDLTTHPATAGDCYVICSDGLSNCVEPGEMAALLAKEYYARVPALLVELANQRGGDDNITVVVAYVANEHVSQVVQTARPGFSGVSPPPTRPRSRTVTQPMPVVDLDGLRAKGSTGKGGTK
jgi:protein phosphatase